MNLAASPSSIQSRVAITNARIVIPDLIRDPPSLALSQARQVDTGPSPA